MGEKSTQSNESSRVVWETLEEWARGGIQKWLQELLEMEVTELLGRQKSERRTAVPRRKASGDPMTPCSSSAWARECGW